MTLAERVDAWLFVDPPERAANRASRAATRGSKAIEEPVRIVLDRLTADARSEGRLSNDDAVARLLLGVAAPSVRILLLAERYFATETAAEAHLRLRQSLGDWPPGRRTLDALIDSPENERVREVASLAASPDEASRTVLSAALLHWHEHASPVELRSALDTLFRTASPEFVCGDLARLASAMRGPSDLLSREYRGFAALASEALADYAGGSDEAAAAASSLLARFAQEAIDSHDPTRQVLGARLIERQDPDLPEVRRGLLGLLAASEDPEVAGQVLLAVARVGSPADVLAAESAWSSRADRAGGGEARVERDALEALLLSMRLRPQLAFAATPRLRAALGPEARAGQEMKLLALRCASEHGLGELLPDVIRLSMDESEPPAVRAAAAALRESLERDG